MKAINKVLCRTYQSGFKLAQPFLPYREPEICHSLDEMCRFIPKGKKALVVTDAGLKSSGVLDLLTQALDKNNIPYAVYDKTCANPTIFNVEEGFSLYNEERCDLLIALGGGSSIDCAKAIGARAAYPKKSISKMKGLMKVRRKIPMLIAVPTTAGTGSEVTVTAVITDSEKKYKYTLNNFTFIPTCAVLDPTLTFSLPSRLTATTGMDALTHAVEAYIGRSTTRQTRKLAKEAVALVFQNILKAYKSGRDFEARQNMLLASYKAGLAFTKSYVGYIHAIAHSLGGQYNIPHGFANAVLMPIVLKKYGSPVYKKLHRLGVVAGVSGVTDTDKVGAQKFIKAIERLNARMEIPSTIDAIDEKDIPKMARHAARESNPLYPVPRLMGTAELKEIYRLAAKGESQ